MLTTTVKTFIQTKTPSLKKRVSGVNANAVDMTIPMPGHPLHNNDDLIREMHADVDRLTQLVEDHDVVFLLMDTRESRWLPSLLGAVAGKLVISCAVGFDTYLVIRHGVVEVNESTGEPVHDPNKLGCYFCADIVAPSNSTHDRTLDQQCTVSRPGVSMISSAMAVELMVSVLHHPEKGRAPGAVVAQNEPESSILGPVVHQIRGMLHSYESMYPTTPCFDRCTACSQTVIDMYLRDGRGFLLNVFNGPAKYLEDVSGLTALKRSMEAHEDSILTFDDDDLVSEDSS